MDVREDLIPSGQGVRTGYKLTRCLGLVVHWIGCSQGHAEVIRKNFGSAECGTHYIIDWYDGHIIRCVPEDEVCYHVGAARYTAVKEQLCGGSNPNWYFVGIECCIDPVTVIPGDYGTAGKYLDLGKPSDAQYAALVEFAADFLRRHGMTENDLYRHYDITGKICPAWFVKDEARWVRFKADVAARLKGQSPVTREEAAALAAQAAAEILGSQDPDRVSPWAKESWESMCARGIFDGTRPGAPLTREQAAVVLTRMEGEYEKKIE